MVRPIVHICQVRGIPPLTIIQNAASQRKSRCLALPTSLESALSPRIDKNLLRDICEDVFQQQAERSKLEFELAQEKFGRENERLKYLLKKRTADLLFTRGLLNVRGVLEFLEDECRETHILKDPSNRQEIWTCILQDTANQRLVKCLARGNDKLKRKAFKPVNLERDIDVMYKFASNSIHGKLSPTTVCGSRKICRHC